MHRAALPWAAGKRHSGWLVQPPLGRPARQLVAGGELEFPQHRGDVAFNGLAGDIELARYLPIGVTAGDQAENLALARRQLVELGVERLAVRGRAEGGESVEDEPGQPG